MAADKAGNLTTAGRVTDMDGISKVQHFDELGEIVGISVHVVAGPRLAGAAMAAAVVRDAAIAVTREEKHLVLEGIGAERPSVTEDHRLPFAPILVIDFRAVAGGDGCHSTLPSLQRRLLTV